MEGTEQEGGRWQEAAWVCSGKCGAVPAGSGGDWRGGGEAGNKHRAIQMPPLRPAHSGSLFSTVTTWQRQGWGWRQVPLDRLLCSKSLGGLSACSLAGKAPLVPGAHSLVKEGEALFAQLGSLTNQTPALLVSGNSMGGRQDGGWGE